MAYPAAAVQGLPELLGDAPAASPRSDKDSSSDKELSVLTQAVPPEFDPADEAAIRRAFDLRFLPMVCVLYAFCFLNVRRPGTCSP